VAGVEGDKPVGRVHSARDHNPAPQPRETGSPTTQGHTRHVEATGGRRRGNVASRVKPRTYAPARLDACDACASGRQRETTGARTRAIAREAARVTAREWRGRIPASMSAPSRAFSLACCCARGARRVDRGFARCDRVAVLRARLPASVGAWGLARGRARGRAGDRAIGGACGRAGGGPHGRGSGVAGAPSRLVLAPACGAPWSPRLVWRCR